MIRKIRDVKRNASNAKLCFVIESTEIYIDKLEWSSIENNKIIDVL